MGAVSPAMSSGYVSAASDKENLIAKMPKIFGKGKGPEDFDCPPPSAATNQRFSMMQGQKTRGLKSQALTSRPSTANNTRSSATSMTGGKLIQQRNGEKFVVCNINKASGYKKFPVQETANFVSTSKSSYLDPVVGGKTKRLEPYRPESARSRLPVRFKGEPKPHVRHCQTRNVSHFTIGAPDKHWENWKKKVVKRKRPVSAV